MDKSRGKILLTLAITAATALLALDLYAFDIKSWKLQPVYIMARESVSILVFFLFYFFHSTTLKNQTHKIHDSISNIIKHLIFIALTYAFCLAINKFEEFQITGTSFDRQAIPTIISTTLLTNIVSFLLIKIYFLFQPLIYYKRKRNTAFFYQFHKLVIFVGAISTVLFQLEIADYEVFEQNIDEQSIILAIAIIVQLILSMRNSWITYLKRKEKYLFLVISFFMFFFIVAVLYNQILGVDSVNIASQSEFFASLVFYLIMFLTIYVGLSFLYVLLHLPTARVFDKKMKEVQFLHSLSTAINSEPDFNKLVLMITNMANEVTESVSSWLEVYEKDNDRLYIASSKNLSSVQIKTASLSTTEGLSGKVFFTKKPQMINNIEKNDEFKYLKLWKKDSNSVIGVPLITTKNEILGIVYCTKSYEHGFDPDDLAMLEAFSNQIVIALENSKLIKESIQHERLEQELKVARDVQLKLLPQEIPVIPNIEMDAIAFTANEVGGDYYDFIQVDDQNFSVIVADVSGKGTSAAFYMAELKGIVKSLSTIYDSPKELLKHTNNVLFNHLEKKSFITAGIVKFDLDNSECLHVRAGHCPLIHYSSSSKELIYHTPKGLGLGLAQEKLFQAVTDEQKIEFEKGDIFILYTDGLNEARNVFDDEYGDDKIGEIVTDNHAKSATEIKNAILDDIIAFAGKAKMHDDMTLAVVKII